MPYVSRQGLTNSLDLYSLQCTALGITTVATTRALSGSIVVPSTSNLRGAIAAAYIDVYFHTVANGAAGVNYVNGTQYIQISNDAGAGWDNCTTVYDNSLHMLGSGILNGIWIYGNTDISSKFSKGDTLTFQWLSSKAFADSINIYTPQIRLRILQTLGGTS